MEHEERNLLQERLFNAEEHFRRMSAEGRVSIMEAEAHYRRMKMHARNLLEGINAACPVCHVQVSSDCRSYTEASHAEPAKPFRGGRWVPFTGGRWIALVTAPWKVHAGHALYLICAHTACAQQLRIPVSLAPSKPSTSHEPLLSDPRARYQLWILSS